MEMLKLRLGDLPFHECGVMLHDVDHSRRIGASMRKEENNMMDTDEKVSTVRLFNIGFLFILNIPTLEFIMYCIGWCFLIAKKHSLSL